MKHTNSLIKLGTDEKPVSIQLTEIEISSDSPPKLRLQITYRHGTKNYELEKVAHIKIAVSVLSGEISALNGLKKLAELENDNTPIFEIAEKSPLGMFLLLLNGCLWGDPQAQRLIDNDLEKILRQSLVTTFVSPPSTSNFLSKKEEVETVAPHKSTEAETVTPSKTSDTDMSALMNQFLFAANAPPKSDKNDDDEQLNKELFSAVCFGNVGRVQDLLDKGANPNYQSQDELGRTPLMKIICATLLTSKDQAVIDLLLKRGADPSIKDSQDHTVHQHLAGKKHIEIAVLKNIAQKFFDVSPAKRMSH